MKTTFKRLHSRMLLNPKGRAQHHNIFWLAFILKLDQTLLNYQLAYLPMQTLKLRVPLKLIVMAVFMPHVEVLIEQPETVRDDIRML